MRGAVGFVLVVALAAVVWLVHAPLAWVAFGLLVVILLTPPARQRP